MHLGLNKTEMIVNKTDHNCVKCWNQPIEDGEER